MFPPPQLTSQGLSSPGEPWVPTAPATNNSVRQSFSLRSTSLEFSSETTKRPSLSFTITWLQLAADRQKTNHTEIGDLPSFSEDFYKEGNEGNESKDILYRGSGEGKLPIRFKQAETFSMQFVKIMEQPKAVHPTSGKKYRWLGFWRKRIGSITWVTIFWRWCEMDPCTGSHAGGRRFSDNCKLAAGGKVLILLKRFSGSGWRHIWRYLHSKFEMEGRMEGEATNH